MYIFLVEVQVHKMQKKTSWGILSRCLNMQDPQTDCMSSLFDADFMVWVPISKSSWKACIFSFQAYNEKMQKNYMLL